MKTCPNCRCVYGDDYAGTCTECGKPLGGVAANGDSGLAFSWARQGQDSARETAQESRMRRGDYSGVRLPPSLIDVASSFIIVDESKLPKEE